MRRCTNTLRKQLRRGVNRSLWLAAARFQLPPGTRLCSWRARRRAAPGPSPLTHGTGTLQEDGGQGHAAPSITALPCGDGVPRTPGLSPPLRGLWAGASLQPRGTDGSCCGGGQVCRHKQPPEPGIFLAGLRKTRTETNRGSVKSDLRIGNPTPRGRGASSQHVARTRAERSTGSTGSTAARPTLSRPRGSHQLLRRKSPPQKLLSTSMTNSLQRSRGS